MNAQQESLENNFHYGESSLVKSPAELLKYHVEHSQLPDAYGVPGRVVEAMKARIGRSALDATQISRDLGLSKRTLQRRLMDQNTSFTEIRDQVRKHYAVDYLLNHDKRIDFIYTALSFSDRTSFTIAFKRWTGYSPNTFRKLLRDYVD